MTRVLIPSSETQLDEVRRLMRAFVAWHRQRHLEDIQLIDQYFDAAAFEAELASLPGKYGPPKGQLLLATHNGEAAGCVALREIDAHTCEMKRMFVYPHLHGKGIGLALAERVIGEAQTSGYKVMRLDTSIRQTEAQTLYKKLGFTTIEPYYDLPETLKNWLVFMEKKL
jgi:GNAT superfamily N-acetyltransferase